MARCSRNVLKQEYLKTWGTIALVGVTSTSSIILTLTFAILQIVKGLIMLGKMVSYKVAVETRYRVIMARQAFLDLPSGQSFTRTYTIPDGGGIDTWKERLLNFTVSFFRCLFRCTCLRFS